MQTMERTTAARRFKNLNAGSLKPEIDSFRLYLNAQGKSKKTVRTYVDAISWFAAEHLQSGHKTHEWADVKSVDIQAWMVHLLDTYSKSYANNQYRAIQQFFKWWAEEEELPNPMAKLTPPKLDETVVPVFTEDEIRKLQHRCEGRTFVQRRDHSIISLFFATGIRLSELAGIRYCPDDPERNDLDLMSRELRIRGKGGKERIVRFGHLTARSLDRYIRIRGKHSLKHSDKLWLGVNNRGPMTASGIYQMIKRRGTDCGVAVNPHKFRHHFSHTWLDHGGAEGDLMELNGWTSPQMLRRYGASARSARARRTYDRIMDES
jgi:site-specific recombinase XerD